MSVGGEAGAPLPMQAIVGGFDDTGAHIFNLDPFGSLLEDKMISTGSGSPFAYGVLEAMYKEDKSVKEMLRNFGKWLDAEVKKTGMNSQYMHEPTKGQDQSFY